MIDLPPMSVQPNVHPDGCRNRQWQEQASWVEVFWLVALAGDVGTDVVQDYAVHVREVEDVMEAVQGALYVLVDGDQDLL